MSCMPPHAEITRVINCQNQLGEGPIWSPLHQVLWWVDVSTPTLWRFDPLSGATDRWPLPKPPAVIALRQSGGLLLLFRRGHLLLDQLAPGDTIPEPLPLDLENDRLNDGRVDAAGRLWVGSLARDLRSPVGKLYLFEGGDRNPPLRPVESGFTLSNGIGWNPERTLMYFADTHSKTIHTFDFDLETGGLSSKRVLTQISGEGGPDGLTVDADGNVWVAIFGAGAVHCYRPDGKLVRSVELPTAYPTSCTFGGVDLDTLYVTSASTDFHGDPVPEGDGGGALWAVKGVGRGQAESLLPY